MAERPLLFELFRLNIVDDDNFAFDFMGRRIRDDKEIKQVLSRSADSAFDVTDELSQSIVRWSLREFVEFDREPSDSSTCGITLGRSILMQYGQTVTEDRFEAASAEFTPPLTETVHLFFYLKRHLVIVEYSSTVLHTHAWRAAVHAILDKSADTLGFLPGIRLEPVPQQQEILNEFRSFDRLTRLRVKLRIPNPELDRRTEELRQEMLASEIREYTQDMKNPAGLSKSESGRPFASVAMAQAGYKEGEVTMSGVRAGRRVTVRTGGKAARGRLDGLRDFVRGIGANTRTSEARNAVNRILEEVDRIAELPLPPEA